MGPLFRSLTWLGFRRWRRKVPGLLLILKARGLVRAVAKWLAGGVAATAKRDRVAAAKPVWLALHIDEFDFPFDAQGAVVANRDLCRWHLCSQWTEKIKITVLGHFVTRRV